VAGFEPVIASGCVAPHLTRASPWFGGGAQLARLPLGERRLIALQRVFVKIEDTRVAATVAAIVWFRALRRRRTRIVTQGVLRRVPLRYFP
jgi:hypothetical protein